jgi:hypothetical protein
VTPLLKERPDEGDPYKTAAAGDEPVHDRLARDVISYPPKANLLRARGRLFFAPVLPPATLLPS